MDEADIQGYYNKHASTIEEGLGSAVDKAVQEGASDPLSSIAKELLVSRGKVGKRQLQSLLDQYECAGVGNHRVRDVMEAVRVSQVPLHLDNAARIATPEWTLEAWLASTEGVTAAIAHVVSSARAGRESDLELVKRLGDATPDEGRERLLALLANGGVLEALATALWSGIEKLRAARAATGAELQAKFLADGAGTLSYSSLDKFYRDLEGMVGAPDPKLEEAMKREHTANGGDRHDTFSTTNYGVTTTSKVEWEFVTTPHDPPSEGWSLEQKLVKAYAPATLSRQHTAGTMALVAARAMPRVPMSMPEMDARLDEKNEELARRGFLDPLIRAEGIAARLYTGPLFVKYNGVLRGLGSEVPSLVDTMVRLCCPKAVADAFMGGTRTSFAEVRKQLNTYTKTLHVVNSSIGKLSKLTVATKVYRGVKDRVLPAQFWEANWFGVKGGTETAFVSTTTDREVAMSYAGGTDHDVGFVLEIQQGMADRGASIGFLSQYPHEEELLFAPLTNLEVQSTRVEGAVMVVTARISVNLTSPPIEKVLAKMKNAFLQLLDTAAGRFGCFDEASSLRRGYKETDVEWYNEPDNFTNATKNVMNELGALTFAKAEDDRHYASMTAGIRSKFFDGDSAEGTLKFGEQAYFEKGLDKFIGPPNPNLADTMKYEHCNSSDSQTDFEVGNYGTKTTPQIEYWFVVDPTEERLQKLGRASQGWPREANNFVEEEAMQNQSEEIDNVRVTRRKARPIKWFEADIVECNTQLRGMGFEPIINEEVYAARLFTGPMFQKYNTVLRKIGELSVNTESSQGRAPDLEEIEKEMKNSHLSMYTTTLHVLNSAIVKLKNLTPATVVYRGLSKTRLPEHLKKEDQFNIRGGVEFGFMSCCFDRDEALTYARQNKESPILLEMQMGMIDRGAELSWLSQYPHEGEVLFAPLSGIEITSYELDQGVIVVKVRPSVNLQSLTIDKVIAKMQRSHLQLIELLTSDLRFAGVPPDALMPLTSLKVEQEGRDPNWFNSMNNFRDATNRVLLQQIKVFKMLVDDHTLSSKLDGDKIDLDNRRARMLKETARFAARAGEHDIAVKLLLKSRHKDTHGQLDENSTPRRLEKARTQAMLLEDKEDEHLLEVGNYTEDQRNLYYVARELIADGLQQPWPATLVSLGKEIPRQSSPPLAQAADITNARPNSPKPPMLGQAASSESQRSSQASVLHPELLKTLFKHLARKADPFKRDAPVLVFEKESGRWNRGVIVSKEEGGHRVLVQGDVVTYDEKDIVAKDDGAGPGAALRHASEMGYAPIVEELLNAGVNVYQVDMRMDTALILAAKAGHDKVCKLLKDKAPKLHDLRNIRRQSAYDLAIAGRKEEVVRLLMPNPSDEAFMELEKDKPGAFTEFLGLLSAGFDGQAEDLPEAKAEAKKKAKEQALSYEFGGGFTPLMLACRAPHEYDLPAIAMIGELLSDKGKAAERLDAMSTMKSCFPLGMAVEQGHYKRSLLLIEKNADVNKVDPTGRAALSFATQSGNLSLTTLLLNHEAKADILRVRHKKDDVAKTQNVDKRTLLMHACHNGTPAVVKLLVERAPDLINKVNFAQESALTFGVRYGHTDVVKLLLDANISIDHEVNKEYWTSLHRAAANGHEAAVRVLLRSIYERSSEMHEKLLNHVDQRMGITPLIAAANSNWPGMVALLLEKHADPTKVGKNGGSALFESAKLGQCEALRVLLKNHRASEDKLLNAIATSKKTVNHADGTECRIEYKQTALMAACRGAHVDAVRSLLNKNGIETTTQGSEEHTPVINGVKQAPKETNTDDALAIAVRQGEEVLVRMLLGHADFSPTSGEEIQLRIGRLEEVEKLADDEHRKAREKDDAEKKSTRRDESTRTSAISSKATPREAIVKEIRTKLEALRKKKSPGKAAHERSRSVFRRDHGGSTEDGLDDLDDEMKEERIEASLKKIKFQRQYPGQLVPPRPTPQQLIDLTTATGSLFVHNGIVHQRGPYNGIFMRVGLFPKAPWSKMWETLKAYVKHHMTTQAKKYEADHSPAALYLVISQAAMQAIELSWLTERGFRFHHYRDPHDKALDDSSAGASADRSANEQAGEFVYYCWPSAADGSGTGKTHDRVSAWSTSIEGATAVLLSPGDGDRVLLVWERDAWNTPGGAVNKGECKWTALCREVWEEIRAIVNEDIPPVYLGGWQQGMARENMINDNFSAFAVTLKSEEFKADGVEIQHAAFLEWKPVLEAWRQGGKQKEFYWHVCASNGEASEQSEKEKISNKLLTWLDTFESGHGLPCKVKKSDQIGHPACKLMIGE